MAGERLPMGLDIEQAQQVTGAMNEAVAINDLDYVQELAEQQTVLPPRMVAGHMHLMHLYGSEDTKAGWLAALNTYVNSLEGQTLPSSQDAIDDIKFSLLVDAFFES